MPIHVIDYQVCCHSRVIRQPQPQDARRMRSATGASPLRESTEYVYRIVDGASPRYGTGRRRGRRLVLVSAEERASARSNVSAERTSSEGTEEGQGQGQGGSPASNGTSWSPSPTRDRMCLISDNQLLEECVPLSAVVFSGGTAFNSVASAFRQLTTRVAHVLPVSDDGGSTAEIVRVLSGPAVGDIRSRCLRLADNSDSEAAAVKRLLAHRLHPSDSVEAKREWTEIVEGEHALWEHVSQPYKHTIRAFLVHFHTQILSHATERFNFTNGSVGNFFFAGARIFFRSLEAAIFLFSRVGRIPEGTLVLPVICTEERITLGAELEDGTVVRGQNQISHPSSSPSVDKNNASKLPSRVKRIFYLSSDGDHQEHEVFPMANPQVVNELTGAEVIIYGMGSLYTSICPTLILKGVGETIAASPAAKVLILNGFHDRETGGCESDPRSMSASDIVQAVCNALNRTYAHTARGARLSNPPSSYITALVVPRGSGLGAIAVDSAELREMGIRHVEEVETRVREDGRALYIPDALVDGIENIVLAHKETQPESD